MKRQITIGEIAEINANALTQRDIFQEIMYLDTGNITRNEIDNIQVLNVMLDKIPSRAKRKVKDKTIIYSTVRPNQEHYGFLENPGDNFIVSTGFSTIDVYDKDTDGKFIYYLLTQKHITDYLHAIGENSVSSYPSINPDDIANLKFAVPDFKTQQSIAAVLSALDKKIALNKQINARLEEMAKTLYDYWFVQFDFPDANGKPYKSSGGEMVFDETLKREIPKGWEVKSLGEVADLYQPATLSEKELENNGQFLVYGANGIIGKYNQFNHEEPVVAVACRGNSCGAINITQPKSWITGNAMVVNPKNKNICIDFIKNTLLVNNLSKVISGSAQPQITRTNFAPLKVILPSEALLKLYSDIVNSMFNKRINQIEQNAKLTQLRDFLLPMLMNGQVSIVK